MTDLSSIGIWLLVASAVAIVVECVVAVIWGLAVGKRTRLLAERVQAERGLLEEDVRRLRLGLEETKLLWQPYQRALKWLRHPLTIALLQSYASRRVL